MKTKYLSLSDFIPSSVHKIVILQEIKNITCINTKFKNLLTMQSRQAQIVYSYPSSNFR